MTTDGGSSGAGDDLETAYRAPITGSQVSSWMIDVIEQACTDPARLPDARSAAILERLSSLGEERVLQRMAHTAAVLIAELEFVIANTRPAEPGWGEELRRRAVLAARGIVRGEGPRSPFLPSSEG